MAPAGPIGGAPGTPPPGSLEGRPELGRLSVAEAREEGERAVEALRLVLDAARRRSYDAAVATNESTAVFSSGNATPRKPERSESKEDLAQVFGMVCSLCLPWVVYKLVCVRV